MTEIPKTKCSAQHPFRYFSDKLMNFLVFVKTMARQA
nr:MAG TPA: hypothetical protein [Caudoviricetes sp.]